MNISMLCEPLSLYSSLFICLRCKRSLQWMRGHQYV
jgi:hypothetical protein